jgi:hypothetical protein
MKQIIIVWFKIESDRQIVENYFNEKSYKNITEMVEDCKAIGLSFDGWSRLGEFTAELNDEMYPTNHWVGYCYVDSFDYIK